MRGLYFRLGLKCVWYVGWLVGYEWLRACSRSSGMGLDVLRGRHDNKADVRVISCAERTDRMARMAVCVMFLRVRKRDWGQGETHAPDGSGRCPRAKGRARRRLHHAPNLGIQPKAWPCIAEQRRPGGTTSTLKSQMRKRIWGAFAGRRRVRLERREVSTCRRWTWAHGGGSADRLRLQRNVNATTVEQVRSALSMQAVTYSEVGWKAA